MIIEGLEEFCFEFEKLYPGVKYSVEENENDSSSCLIYVDDPSLVEEEVEYCQIEDLAVEFLKYEDIKIVHEFPENLTID